MAADIDRHANSWDNRAEARRNPHASHAAHAALMRLPQEYVSKWFIPRSALDIWIFCFARALFPDLRAFNCKCFVSSNKLLCF